MIKVRYERGVYSFYCVFCGHRISWTDDNTRLVHLVSDAQQGASSAERCESCGCLLLEPPSNRVKPYTIHENSDGTFDVYDAKSLVSFIRHLPTRLAATICAERLAARNRRGMLYWLYMDRKRRGDMLGY